MKISTRRLFVRGSAEAPAGCRGPALARKVVLPRRPEPWVKARLSQEDFLVSRSAGAEWSEKRLAHSAASDKSRCPQARAPSPLAPATRHPRGAGATAKPSIRAHQ